MDLKFTFGGSKQSDHEHGSHGDAAAANGAGPGIPLPFSTVPAGTSSVLELAVRRSADGSVVAEALSGDGVNYAGGEAPCGEGDIAALARATRSALSRAVAGLEGPLSEAVTAVVLDLGGAEAEVLAQLGVEVEAADRRAVITEALQRRIGVAAGTPIRW